jgi:tRNA threonylcarbamoyladenosine biosynthesis protein TsaB
MTILALEFSSARRSVALAQAGQVLAEASETGGHRTTNAFRLLDSVLSTARIPRAQIDTLAVGLGPGSYTGIRAAIALAQGWELATGVKLLGLSSAEVLAAQAQKEKLFGRVNVIIDAQRSEFYLTTWHVSAVELQAIAPLKIVPQAHVEKLRAAGEICAGPDAAPALFPTAARLAQLAWSRNDFVAGKDLSPIYLRETTFVKAPPARY